MKKIPFNVPPVTGTEFDYIKSAIENRFLCGDGPFTKKCQSLLEVKFGVPKVLLTPSCTAALEMAAILLNIQPGDEVIMPSYTFVSTANAFVLRGGKIIFVDIRPDTLNIDEKKIESAITSKTKAIVPVHYAGVACEMDEIMDIARRHKLFVVEDAAQGVMSKYKGKALGTIGDLGCYSFHETKNYTSGGEGGALLVNASDLVDRAEIIREKGTNRQNFLNGIVDKYSWIDIGSSFLPSELQAAFLFGQMGEAESINNDRLKSWTTYHQAFKNLEERGLVTRPCVPEACIHNAHMYYLKTKDIEQRSELISYLRERGIGAVFHYVPLHSAPASTNYGRFDGRDEFTTKESERLVRLPLWFGIQEESLEFVIQSVHEFFS